MKIKTVILCGLCAFGLCVSEVYAVISKESPFYNAIINMPSIFEKIELRGDLLNSISPNAIEAGASDDAIYIGFNQSFGNVDISIYNDMSNLVYRTVVNSDAQPVVIIPFVGFASGSYTIELNNANGYAEGDFEHD